MISVVIKAKDKFIGPGIAEFFANDGLDQGRIVLEAVEVFALRRESGLRRLQPQAVRGFLLALHGQLLMHFQKENSSAQRNPGE